MLDHFAIVHYNDLNICDYKFTVHFQWDKSNFSNVSVKVVDKWA